MGDGSSQTTTEGIRISARAQFVEQESKPDEGVFLFVYRIHLENVGERPAQLLSRHWVVIDANHHRQDVRGEGVIGKQPHLEPGDVFEYTSSVALKTAWGTMEGAYDMIRGDGETFEARIGRFLLTPASTSLETTV